MTQDTNPINGTTNGDETTSHEMSLATQQECVGVMSAQNGINGRQPPEGEETGGIVTELCAATSVTPLATADEGDLDQIRNSLKMAQTESEQQWEQLQNKLSLIKTRVSSEMFSKHEAAQKMVKQMTELTNKLNSSLEHEEEMKGLLGEEKSRSAMLKDSLSTAQEALSRQAEEHTSAVKQLREELTGGLQKEREVHSHQVEEVRASLAAAEKRAADVELAATQVREELQKLTAQSQDLEKRVDVLTAGLQEEKVLHERKVLEVKAAAEQRAAMAEITVNQTQEELQDVHQQLITESTERAYWEAQYRDLEATLEAERKKLNQEMAVTLTRVNTDLQEIKGIGDVLNSIMETMDNWDRNMEPINKAMQQFLEPQGKEVTGSGGEKSAQQEELGGDENSVEDSMQTSSAASKQQDNGVGTEEGTITGFAKRRCIDIGQMEDLVDDGESLMINPPQKRLRLSVSPTPVCSEEPATRASEFH